MKPIPVPPRFGCTGLVALMLATVALPAAAQSSAELRALRAQMEQMARRIEELEAQQAQTAAAAQAAAERPAVTSGSRPGSIRLPGSETDVVFGGYIKTDFIYDTNEALGDLFVPEAITTGDGGDNNRFRAHARQSRVFLRTFTPTDYGQLTSWLELDLFGTSGNEVFSNSTEPRLRHAVVGLGDFLIGQTWSNFQPIESAPSTIDFNGPAGIPFIRQAQVRYTRKLTDALTLSASLENSELSARRTDGTAISESTNLGIRAGVDKAPDVTAALTWKGEQGLVKLAGVGRLLGSPGAGDDEFGWGLNLSGNTSPWTDGKLMGSLTYGDGVGRYLVNGFGQDAFVDAAGNLDTVTAWGVTLGVSQKVTDTVTLGLAYGRSEFDDSVRAADLDNVNTVHLTALWSPTPRWTLGAEAIWGNREDADGASDDNLRFQSAFQLNF